MPVTAHWYKEWFNSPYYHKLYFERGEKEAAGFIDNLLTLLNPPAGSRMLDVACGRGRHARILAAKGFDVTGIDLAPDSIAFAKHSENEHLHFFQHDMRLPFHINYFHYAFNFFTSFGYFYTEREHYNAIRTISNALQPAGIFMLDFLNVHYAMDHFVQKVEKKIDHVHYYITKWFDDTHFYKKIEIEDPIVKAPLEFTERVAKFTLGDFTDMFAFHHLQIQEVFGDYELHKFDMKQSPRLIVVAKKR